MRLKRLGLEEGLSQVSALSLIQDRTGFIWIATQDGLNRYDGYSFKVYKNESDNPRSLPTNYMSVLYEDSTGVIWVGTFDGGLCKYDKKTDDFKTYTKNLQNPKSLTSNSIQSICEDKYGDLWIGTVGGGLCRYNKNTDDFKNYMHSNDPNSIGADTVLALYEDSKGKLWCGTRGGGLCEYQRDKDSFIVYRNNLDNSKSICSNNVQALGEDTNGNLLIGTDYGLSLYNYEGVFLTYKNDGSIDSLINNNVQSIFKDKKGNVWIGTINGFCLYKDKKLLARRKILLEQVTEVNKYNTRSFLEDNQGGIWIGTFSSGVFYYNKLDKRFFVHRTNLLEGSTNNTVYSIYEDHSGKILVGTTSGLYKYDLDIDEFTSVNNIFGKSRGVIPNVISLIEDKYSSLWIGTISNGVYSYTPKYNRLKIYRHDPNNPNSLSSDSIRRLCLDREGILWVSTYTGGICRYDSKADIFINYKHDPNNPNSLSENEVSPILGDHNGIIWSGTYNNGLCGFDKNKGEFKSYKHDPKNPNSLARGGVCAIYEDSKGVIWVGTTSNGLSKFDRDSGTFKTYRISNGLPSDFITGILEDSQGNLWISTAHGISKFNPQTEKFKNFDVNDGLQSNEFWAGAYCKTKDGQILFGGSNGFNSFFPEQVLDNQYIPPVVITEFKKFNKPVKLETSITESKEIVLNYWENIITFEFAALNFVNPQKNQYVFKLEGFDKDWVTAGTQRSATYTNLDGGTYVFHVKGSNNDGLWNEEGTSVKVIVIPPPWKRWWAYTLYLIVTIGSIGGGFGFQVNRIRNKAALEEAKLRANAAEIEAEAAQTKAQAAEQLAKQNAELDKMVIELKGKNEQLIISQRQADRIFSALAEALPGTLLDGKYKLEEKIGSGGFGAVFRAKHLALNKDVAVKVFKPSPGNDSAGSIERFKLEGISASRIKHENAIEVMDLGISQEGIAYLVMELLKGHSLQEEFQIKKPLTLKRSREIIVPVCEALAEAHKIGVIHRDIKPENIYIHEIEGREVIKLVDFGVAKMVSEDTNEELKNLTATGGIVGTPTYIAPERLRELPYDGRSDVYSIGIVLYEMLCGSTPFLAGAKGLAGVIMGHLLEKPPSMREFNAEIPEEIENVVVKALAKDPNKRPTAEEFAKEFDRVAKKYD